MSENNDVGHEENGVDPECATVKNLFLPMDLSNQTATTGNKISVVGAGAVGMAAVISLITQGITNNIALVDAAEKKLMGEVLDLKHGSKFIPGCKIEGSKDFSVTADSAICIVTAGVRQRVGDTRLDLVERNTELLKDIIPQLLKYSPNTIFLIASNPVDILTYVTWKLSKLPKNRVIGSGCNLDTSRFVYLLSEVFGVAPRSCHGHIIGEHGDSSVPVWSGVSIGGMRPASLNASMGKDNDPEKWMHIHKMVVDSARDVIELKGYTSWAVGLAIAEISRAILNDDGCVQTVSTYVKGLHGVKEEVFLSLPCVVGRQGIHKVIKQTLTEQERTMFQRSAKVVYEIQAGIKLQSN